MAVVHANFGAMHDTYTAGRYMENGDSERIGRSFIFLGGQVDI